MDILEYLDAYDIYNALYNLNYRLNLVINDVRVSKRVHLFSNVDESQFNFMCNEILPQIQDRILSLVIAHNSRIHTLTVIFNSLERFTSLRKLTLIDIETKIDLKNILAKQQQLSSIDISTYKIDNEMLISDICGMIICEKLPRLKECSLSFRNNCIFKNVTTSYIKYLTIGWCSMTELIVLLHHTPTLKTLNIRYLHDYDFSTLDDTNLVVKILNVFLYCVPFNNIELLLKH
ncbi:unnamed protein product, partial [Didymodactylos carnosus]